jgi:hypothetical protein
MAGRPQANSRETVSLGLRLNDYASIVYNVRLVGRLLSNAKYNYLFLAPFLLLTPFLLLVEVASIPPSTALKAQCPPSKPQCSAPRMPA